MYTYKATVKSIYDGDTIRVDIDLGFGIIFKNQPLRLLGIDTPEVRGEERSQGLISKKFVEERIPVGSVIRIATQKDRKEKFGRYLATVFYGEDSKNLNEELVQNGMAKLYE
jgi:micrococcal nuclease